MSLIKCIAIDLDDTLIDTTNLIVPKAARKACEELIAAGCRISIDECNLLRRDMAKSHSHKEIFKIIGEQYRIKHQVGIAKAIDAFYKPEIPEHLPIFPEALRNLEYLKSKGYKLFLVTSGDHDTQDKKINATGVRKYMREVYIISSLSGQKKIDAFSKIISNNQIKPSELLSFGNRLASEIRDAKTLGATTCYFKYGEHVGEEPAQPEDVPDYTITDHKEFLITCNL